VERKMEIRVLGCYGSHLPGFGTTCFQLDTKTLIDGGTITSVLTLEEQLQIEYVFLTHAHLDHIRDIMFLVDNIFYLRRPFPLVLVSTPGILETVHNHLFNGQIWPDFSLIPSPANPVLRLQPIQAGEPLAAGSWMISATPVNHTVETVAYTAVSREGAVIFIGDTGPTEAIWQEANRCDNLKGIFIEVSFPNRMEELAALTRHLTPRTLSRELEKLRHKEAGVYVFHLKLQHDAEITRELLELPQKKKIHILRDGEKIRP